MNEHDGGPTWRPPPPPPPPSSSPPPAGWPPSGSPPAGWVVAPPVVHAPADRTANAIGWLIMTAAVVVMVAAFLPWATFLGLSVSGVGGDDVGGAKDGVLTLMLAVPAGVLGLLRGLGRARLGAAIVAVVVGALIALIAVVDVADIGDTPASVGVGLWLTLLAGLALIGLGVAGIVKR